MFALDLMRRNLCSVAIAWNFLLARELSLVIYRFEGFASHPSFGKFCRGAFAWKFSLVTFSLGAFAWKVEMFSFGNFSFGSSA